MTEETFDLPKDVERELIEIFTDRHMEAVKAACRRYLYESGKKRPGLADAGRTLIKIAEKARELDKLLGESNSALERMHLHLSEEHNIHDVFHEIWDIKEKLRLLENRCLVNPATERAENKQRGREPGTANTAKRALAYQLWDTYRRAHGRPPGRVWDAYQGAEVGPMIQVVEILMPILGLKNNMERYFREIGENWRDMDNK